MEKIALISLLLTSVVFADFTGNWKGTGIAESHEPEPWKKQCALVRASFVHTSSALTLVSGEEECEQKKWGLPGWQAEIKGSELWLDGKKLGDITPTTFELKFMVPMPFVVHTFRGTLIGSGEIKFEHYYDDGNNDRLISGTLKR